MGESLTCIGALTSWTVESAGFPGSPPYWAALSHCWRPQSPHPVNGYNTHTLQASLHCQLGLWKVCGVISQGDNKYMYNVIDNDLVVDYSPSSRDPLGQSSLSAGTHPVLVLGRDNGRASGFLEPCSVHTGSMSSASHFLLHTWDMYNTILISTTL